MILFFHLICLLARQIATNISKSWSDGKLFSDEDEENDSERSNYPDFMQTKGYSKHPVYMDGTLKFFPPVYVQRYETVALILKDSVWKKKIRKVVDFGCAELGFFMYLKNIESVTEIVEVDINAELLERFSQRAAPLTCDYLMNKNSKPLDVYIMAGSVADYDDALMNCDAVVCIELIEHLDNEAFYKLPYNIFHKIRPKLAVFTTPNADFNSLFPNFKDVRNLDHKFEWTRKEFFNWTQEVIKLYPEYTVRFYGIGAGPEGTENLGCCSQMAVFQRIDEAESFASARDSTEGVCNYKLIKHYKYPVYIDTRTTEEKIVHEIQYQVLHLNTLSAYYNYDNNESEIPLTLLKDYVTDLCPDEEELRLILQKNGMILRNKNSSWYLVYSEIDSYIQKSESEESLDDETSENIFDIEDKNYDEEIWEKEIHLESLKNSQSAGSLDDMDVNLTENNEKNTFKNFKHESLLFKNDEVRSAPNSCNHLVRKGKENSINHISALKINNTDEEKMKKNLSRSRIPRKRNENKEEKHSPERNILNNSPSHKSQSSHQGG